MSDIDRGRATAVCPKCGGGGGGHDAIPVCDSCGGSGEIKHGRSPTQDVLEEIERMDDILNTENTMSDIDRPTAGYVCEACSVRYEVRFLIPPEIWAEYISPTGDDRGYYCLQCTDTMLRRRGFKLTWYGSIWRVTQ